MPCSAGKDNDREGDGAGGTGGERGDGPGDDGARQGAAGDGAVVGRVARESVVFFFTDAATTEIYTLSLHDALPISGSHRVGRVGGGDRQDRRGAHGGGVVGAADRRGLGAGDGVGLVMDDGAVGQGGVDLDREGDGAGGTGGERGDRPGDDGARQGAA